MTSQTSGSSKYLAALADKALQAGDAKSPAGVVLKQLAWDFNSFPLNLKTKKGAADLKQIYAHQTHSDLFYEVAVLPPMANEKTLTLFTVYDLTAKEMLFVSNTPHYEPVQNVAVVPLNETAKMRLYNDYDLNIFDHTPVGTIDELIGQFPTDEKTEEILRHGKDYEPANRIRGQRFHWLDGYVDDLFRVKAVSLNYEYATPLFGPAEILCMRSTSRSQTSTDKTMICDVREGRILEARSDYYTNMMTGMREYDLLDRGMKTQEYVHAVNALYLIEQAALTSAEPLKIETHQLNDPALAAKAKGIEPA